MKTGARADITRTFSSGEIAQWAALTGQPDGELVFVPEPLVAALFSYLLGVRLPGPGTNYLKQEIDWRAPAPVGEELVASVEITRLRPDKHLVDLATTCRTAAGTAICTGRALVYVEDVAAG